MIPLEQVDRKVRLQTPFSQKKLVAGSPEGRRMSKRKIGGKRIGYVLFVALTVLVILISFSPIVGLRFDAVLSGSMSPALNTGDLIIVTATSPENLKVGDIIVFRSQIGDGLVCHRLVTIESDDGLAFQAKGDANEGPDAFMIEPEDIVGKVQTNVPSAGQAVQWLRGPFGLLAIVALAAAALLLPDAERKESGKETAKEDVNGEA
jgi:signal peptidase